MEANRKTKTGTYPACCDIFSDNDKIVIRCEMPGVLKENLDIRVNNDELIIFGKKNNTENDKGEYHIKEIHDRDYLQRFTLDSTVDQNNISASLKNGILNLTLGIKESEKLRKINVEAR